MYPKCDREGRSPRRDPRARRDGAGCLARVLRSEEQIAALFGETAFQVSVDGRPVDGPESTVPVTAASRVVLYRRQGPTLDVLTRGVVRGIWLN